MITTCATFRRNILPPFSGINTLLRDPEDGVITLLRNVCNFHMQDVGFSQLCRWTILRCDDW